MNDILFIAPQVIYPQNSGGKKSIVGRVLNDYPDANVILLQINVNNEDDTESKKFFESNGVNVITYNFSHNKKSGLLYYLRYFKSFRSKLPKYVQNYYQKEIVELVDNVCSTEAVNSIVCEQIYTIVTIPEKYKDKCSIVCHNVESDLLFDHSRISNNLLLKIAYYIEGKRALSFEGSILKKYMSSLIFLSEIDAFRFQEIYDIKFQKIKKANNELFIEYKVERNNLKNFILFPGSINFEPNLDGLMWFSNNIYTSLIKNFPDLMIYITGSYSNKNRRKFKHLSNMKFLGYQSDSQMKKLFSECICIISPILKGSGIKIKNLEALQNNIPIIMTKNSAKGFKQYYDLDNSASGFLTRLISTIRSIK